MSNNIFDLEQQLLGCWHVTDDIERVTKYFLDDPKFAGKIEGEVWDEIANKYLAIKELYEVRFNEAWNTFEKTCKEYHEYRKQAERNEQNVDN